MASCMETINTIIEIRGVQAIVMENLQGLMYTPVKK